MLIDNKKDRYPEDKLDIKTVWDFIREYAGYKPDSPEYSPHGKMDIVTGYFTLRALSILYHEIPEGDAFRIVSSEMVNNDVQGDKVINLLNGDQSIEQAISISDCARDAKAFLERNNVQIKAITDAFCHAKAYMFQNDNPHNDSFYLTGSSNLTDAGLGLKQTANVELNIGAAVKLNDKDYQEVCSWFEDIWKQADDTIASDPNNKKSPRISVKEYFIRQIDQYFRKYTPEQIYYKVLFELFHAEIDIDNSIEHTQDMSQLQTSVIWKTLFNYQQKGVISLIKMLRKYGGAILADAVGLGKTFSALAVIKYFQIQNYTTVVLCPKKLEQNWRQYRKGHSSRFEKDEFDYQVRFHTDLQNDRLENSYDDYKLSYLQTRKKVLVVIDESHNLRNERSGRYQELVNKLICNQAGQERRDVKILMLSATPINTGLRDIKGQFNLIGHNQDDAFKGEDFSIDSLKNLFAEAQRDYTAWTHDDNRTIGQFITMLPPKFFNLTDKLIVARTRKLIEKTLGEELGFPDKDRPENIYQGVDHIGQLQTADDIYGAFDELGLTAYQPSLFLHESPKEARKEASRDWDDDVNRERFLVKMMGILFMKRLESSWFSCMTTVKKVLDVHERTLQLVNDFKAQLNDGTLPETNAEDVTDVEDDTLIDEYALRKGTIHLSEMKNLGGFECGLRRDVNKLRAIYKNFETFYEGYTNGKEKDDKLEKLIDILHNKQRQKNKKVVVFTAFADTAQFLFDELSKRGFFHMAIVSGQHISTTGHQRTTDFTEVLQSFAPYSKLYKELDWSYLYEQAQLSRDEFFDDEKQRWNVNYAQWQELISRHSSKYSLLLDDPIDILIATDCLSEGQNLQDADMQVNYDIHWNPVRLIQRFGRIDRIGSPNKRIRCVNFWPAKSFDEYLHLESRIQDRMSMMTLVGSETQELNDSYKRMIADNPLVDKNADRLLEELQHNSISDIESPRTLSLKDFSFEVYRQDLLEYLKAHQDVSRQMPNGIYSGFRFQTDLFAEKIPESLVAVIGYPHREASSDQPYKELYLMCQPISAKVSSSVGFHEINRAEILELLRTHKKADRLLPDWIDAGSDSKKIARLSAIVQDWMRQKAPRQATSIILDIAKSNKVAQQADRKPQRLEEKFRLENFDLIVWEYVSAN